MSITDTPYRAPGVLAAGARHRDHLSSGRLNVGIGGGWMPEEFAAASASYIFPKRHKHVRETIEIMQGIWTNDLFEYHGDSVSTMGIELDEALTLDAGDEMPLVEIGDDSITVLKLFPGLKAPQVENLILPRPESPIDGVVMACFGAGNAPSDNTAFMNAIAQATGTSKPASGNNVVIVDVTQPAVGSADLNLYATGNALKTAGVTSGYDMTTEAALTKLFYLFGLGLLPDAVRAWMEWPLAGELTRPASSDEPPKRSDLAAAGHEHAIPPQTQCSENTGC